MNIFLVFTLISVVTDAYVINNKLFSSVSVYDYHRTTGIPFAEKIREFEKKITNLQRITGGLATEIEEVPYQVGLIISVYDRNSICGGTIISNTRILTAGHCYYDGKTTAQVVTVVFGSTLLFFGGIRIETNDVVMHSGFNPETAENDIAVIRVPGVTFTSQIQPVALPSGDEVNMDFTGYPVIASGFGMTSDEEDIALFQTVSSVTVSVISNVACAAIYGDFVKGQHLCTSGSGAKGTCAGDSGGPLVVELNSRTVLIGLTSYGAEFCTGSYPSAYVRITEFLDWISNQL